MSAFHRVLCQAECGSCSDSPSHRNHPVILFCSYIDFIQELVNNDTDIVMARTKDKYVKTFASLRPLTPSLLTDVRTFSRSKRPRPPDPSDAPRSDEKTQAFVLSIGPTAPRWRCWGTQLIRCHPLKAKAPTRRREGEGDGSRWVRSPTVGSQGCIFRVFL